MKIQYEAHITSSPVFDERLTFLKKICDSYDFKVAELLMKKHGDDEPEISRLDSFCSAKDENLIRLTEHSQDLIFDLQRNNFKVSRYKIELILVDSIVEDTWEILEKS